MTWNRLPQYWPFHYSDVIMGTIASQITSLTIVYSTVYSDTDQRKHQSSASLAFVRGIHRGPVNSPHKGPFTRKMFPFDDVIILWEETTGNRRTILHFPVFHDISWVCFHLMTPSWIISLQWRHWASWCLISTACSIKQQRKRQSPGSLALSKVTLSVFPHKGSVNRNTNTYVDAIIYLMILNLYKPRVKYLVDGM